MSYITPAQLADIPGALELAELTSERGHRPVATALMDATLRGGDREAFPPADVARADVCLARINAAIADTTAVIDGYLARRYSLPLASTPALLVAWARAIVRYRLHGDRISGEGTDPVVRDYRDTLRQLEHVAAGKFSLGIEDPTTGSTGLGDFVIHGGDKQFGRSERGGRGF